MYIGDKKMKVVQIGQTKYYVRGKEDAISVAHEMAKSGYSISEIARALGVRESTVRKYLSDCW